MKLTAETRFEDIVGSTLFFEPPSLQSPTSQTLLYSPPTMIPETPPSPHQLNKTDTFDARKREIDALSMMKMSTLERVNKENTLKIEIL